MQDMSAAEAETIPDQFTSSAADTKQHLQLLQSGSSVITAVVGKLAMLETCTQSASGVMLNGAGIAQHICTNQCMYQALVRVLLCCSKMFQSWPVTWPVSDTAGYKSVRLAMQSLMQFLLKYTRDRGSMWCNILERFPEYLKEESRTVLSLHLSYITSITDWSASRLGEEVAALPVNFFSLACCLVLDMVSEYVEAMPEGGSAASTTMSRCLHAIKSPHLSNKVVSLGHELNNIFGMLVTGHNTWELQRRISNPAVISLFKYIMVVSPSIQDSSLQAEQISLLAARLTQTLPYLFQRNTSLDLQAEQELGNQALAHNQGPNPDFRALKCTPVQLVSDVDLLQVLLKQMPSPAMNVKAQYELIAAILQSWHNNTPQCITVPRLSEEAQRKGIHLIARHCMSMVKSWMQHQQHIQQRKSSCSCCIPSHHTFSMQQQEVVNLVFHSNILHLHERHSDSTYEQGGWLNYAVLHTHNKSVGPPAHNDQV